MITTSDFTTNNTEPIRVFHLGRELKSGGRSLETLGIGRFRNFIVHVHVAAGVVRRSNEQQRASRKRTPVAAAAVMDKQQPVVVVDLLHDSDDEVAVVAPTTTASKRPRVLQKGRYYQSAGASFSGLIHKREYDVSSYRTTDLTFCAFRMLIL